MRKLDFGIYSNFERKSKDNVLVWSVLTMVLVGSIIYFGLNYIYLVNQTAKIISAS